MAKEEIYRAQAKPERGARAAGVSPYTIEVRFQGGLTAGQKNAFKAAADRWTKVIVGDLPPVMVMGEIIDDLVIVAQGSAIDGPGQILGQAGPTHLRPGVLGSVGFLPARGVMAFDTADLQKMEQNGTLGDVITHEMGHVLGIGTVWSNKGLLKGAAGSNPTFAGPLARKEYGKLRGTGPRAVPVENSGGPGTRNSHWRESVFMNELMTGFVAGAANPLSRMTVASLADLGYTVDFAAAEAYTLPNLLQMAERGVQMAHEAPAAGGVVLPSIPIVLPDDSPQ